jgi:glycosyltransferase domain-containing protein
MNLTVVCISFNRQAYLKRLIEFHQTFFQNTKLVIMDGTDFPMHSNVINKKDIIYYSRPNKSYFERWIESSKYINTKYTLFVADDEFQLASTVKDSVNFLEKNHNYVSCGGLPLLFTVFFRKYIHAMQIYNGICSNDLDDPFKRQKKWLEDSLPVSIYSVLRTNFFLSVVNSLKKVDKSLFIDPSFIIEYVVELAAAFQGKNKILNKFCWFRSLENTRIKFTHGQYPIDFWNKNKEKKDAFLNITHGVLVGLKNSHLGKKYKENLNQDFKEKIAKYELRQKSQFKTINRLVQIFYNIIPNIMKKFIRYKFKINGEEIEIFLKKRKVKCEINEIRILKNLILDFHKKN